MGNALPISFVWTQPWFRNCYPMNLCLLLGTHSWVSWQVRELDQWCIHPFILEGIIKHSLRSKHCPRWEDLHPVCHLGMTDVEHQSTSQIISGIIPFQLSLSLHSFPTFWGPSVAHSYKDFVIIHSKKELWLRAWLLVKESYCPSPLITLIKCLNVGQWMLSLFIVNYCGKLNTLE